MESGGFTNFGCVEPVCLVRVIPKLDGTRCICVERVEGWVVRVPCTLILLILALLGL